MAGCLNKVMLIGRLGQDPEVRTMQNGNKVANISLATSERFKDKQGNQQDKTEWHRVVIFGRVADIVEQYLRKGSQVLIEGQLRTRKWTDQSGQDHYATEVVVSGFGGNMTMLGGQQTQQNPTNNTYATQQTNKTTSSQTTPAQTTNYSAELDDEIPF